MHGKKRRFFGGLAEVVVFGPTSPGVCGAHKAAPRKAAFVWLVKKRRFLAVLAEVVDFAPTSPCVCGAHKAALKKWLLCGWYLKRV